MSDSNPAVPVFDLGFHGAFRLVVAPEVRLTPSSEALVVDTMKMSPMPLKGTCVNLPSSVPCTLEWLVATDLLCTEANPNGLTVRHPRKTMLVRTGDNYEVKERTGEPGHEQENALTLDAFELGLIGQGRLGYSIVLDLLGKPSVTVDPAHSPISLDLGIELEIRLVPTPEPATPPANVMTTPGPAPLGRALGPGGTEQLLVGTEVQLEAKPAKGLKGHAIELSLAEYDATGLEVLDGTATAHRWTAVEGGTEKLRWRVGMVRRSEDHPYVLACCYGADAGQIRRFGWSLSVPRPGPPRPTATTPAGSTPISPAVEPDHIHGFPQLFCNAAHPGLTSLDIGLEHVAPANLDPDTDAPAAELQDLVIKGTFVGFEPHIWFNLSIELMAKTKATINHQEVEQLCSLSKLLGDLGRSDPQVRAARVELGAFHAPILRLSDCRAALAAKDPDLKLFAVVELAPGGVGVEGQPLFSSVAGYTANIETSRHEDGFAPFKAGMFVPPEVATGVCSKLVDLKGGLTVLTGTATSVPPEKLADYRWFLATVAGEAMACRDGSLRGVAHAIMNRVNSTAPEWKSFTTVELAIKAPSQFDSYLGKRSDGVVGSNEPFKQALAYFERKYVKKDPQATVKEPRLAHIETVVMPIFLRLNTRDNGHGVTHFYSPALLGTPPGFAVYPEVTAHFTSSEERSGAANLDFRFFAMKLRASERPQ